MSEIRLKDFILTDIPEPEKKVYANKPPVEYDFNVEYENDTDFILRRKTSKTDRSLVVIVSQAQVYIKDNKSGGVERVVNKEQLVKFKSGMTSEPVFSKLIWKPFRQDTCWGRSRYENCIKVTDQFVEFLDAKEIYKILANKKLNPFKETRLVSVYRHNPETFNKKLEMEKVVKLLDPSFAFNDYNGPETIDGFMKCSLHESLINKTKEIIEGLNVDYFKRWIRMSSFQEIISEYNVDFKTFVTYLLYTIKYRNGLCVSDFYYGSNDSFTFSDYRDYLSNQKEMYGKVKEKYPQYWLSEKQMMCNKYNAWKKIQEQLGFKINQEEMQQYEYDDGFMKVFVPLMSSDILDEAQQQQHCVASYVDRIRAGQTHILFIRYMNTPEESLLTVEVTPNKEIVQVRGFQNRAYTHAEWDFMKEWADKKGLELKVKEPVEENDEV